MRRLCLKQMRPKSTGTALIIAKKKGITNLCQACEHVNSCLTQPIAEQKLTMCPLTTILTMTKNTCVLLVMQTPTATEKTRVVQKTCCTHRRTAREQQRRRGRPHGGGQPLGIIYLNGSTMSPSTGGAAGEGLHGSEAKSAKATGAPVCCGHRPPGPPSSP
jgi:hypothetical protein